jgi:hypothetical protein
VRGDVQPERSGPLRPQLARRRIAELFAPPVELTVVHTARTPVELADALINFKPWWVHHEESKAHVRSIVEELGASA